MPATGIFTSWIVVLIMAIVVTGCDRSPPEERLREAVPSLQRAIEAGDAAGTRDWLADDFVGPDGLDPEGARRLVLLMHMRHRNVDIHLGPLQVELQDRHARVGFTALVTGGAGALLPEQGRLYNVRTGWRLEDEDWRLSSVDWSAASP